MKSWKTRALLGIAAALFLTPGLLRADGISVDGMSSDLHTAPSFGAGVLVYLDDLVAMNASDPDHRQGSSSEGRDSQTASPTVASDVTTAPQNPENDPASVASGEEETWILGAFGALCVMGLGVTFAGFFWSGPRCLTKL